MKSVNKRDIVVLDTETTGVNPKYDEILELAIVDYDGNKLFDNRIKPTKNTSWDMAETVHGISPKDVEGLPTINDYATEIKSLLEDKIIVGYNAEFDCDFLAAANLISDNFQIDIMKPFSEIYGEWNDYYGNYRFQKLITCADYYGYKWEGSAHGALADTKATLYCFKEMIKQDVDFGVDII